MLTSKRDIDMLSGPLTKNIIIYTIPIVLSGILQLLFNAADLVIVGRFCGSNSVAAVGATGSLITLIVNFFMGLSIGAGVTIAQAYGARNDREVRDAVHTAIPTAILAGALITLIGIFFSEPLLRLMGNPDDVIGKSTVYMQCYFAGSIGSLVYNFGAVILRAAGDTKSPLTFLTVAGVANVLLNIVFVVGFDMDVAGVGLATAVSQFLSAILVLIRLMNRHDSCHLNWSKLKIHPKSLSKMLQIGLPSGIQSSIFAISNVIIQSSINSFGSVVMSGVAAGGNIEGFLYTTQNAFSHTTMNFVGQNIGAKQYKRALKVVGCCLILCASISLLIGVCFLLFSHQLLSIYISDSAEAISYGMQRMSVITCTYFLCGLMEITTGALRGMGRSMIPMIVSIIGVCGIRIAWIYTIFQLPQFHTIPWLFVSYPLSWIPVLVVQGIMMLIVFKKMKRDPSEQPL